MLIEFFEAAESDNKVANTMQRTAFVEKEASEAYMRAANFESNSIALSFTIEGLRSNNLVFEKQVEELRMQNLQLETKMISGLYARSHFQIISMNDSKQVTIYHTFWDTRVFILLPKAPVPVSINGTLVWHPGLIRGLAGLIVGSELGKSYPIAFGNNKNILFADLGTPEWARLEHPKETTAKFMIRYTELDRETNLWKKIEIKGKDIYFDNIKQNFQ